MPDWHDLTLEAPLGTRVEDWLCQGQPRGLYGCMPSGACRAGRGTIRMRVTGAERNAAWRPPGGFHAAAEVRHSGKVYVNETNSDAAAAYTVVNLRAGYEHRLGGWQVREFVRADNVADRLYAGSVIVAEARGRFFEPAPGRNYFAGVEVTRAF